MGSMSMALRVGTVEARLSPNMSAALDAPRDLGVLKMLGTFTAEAEELGIDWVVWLD